ncbi:MAG: peptidylprolyl isomerase [Psychrobacter sp.]|nr:peptidylprolyl isomerase [Psychrobacter sp.]
MTVLSFHSFGKVAKLTLSLSLAMTIASSVNAAEPVNSTSTSSANKPYSVNPDTKLAIAEARASSTLTGQNQRLSPANSTDGIIALVNDNAILKSDLINAIAQTQRRAAAAGESLPAGPQLQNDVLNALILRELQLSLINRVGIKPDSDAVNARLAQIAQAQGLDSLTALQQRLDSEQPGSYAKLRAQIIEDAAIQALQQRQIASRVRITDQDVDAFLASPEASRLNQSEYQTIHVRVPYMDDYSRLTPQQRQAALDVANALYQTLKTSNIDVNAAMLQVQGDYPIPLQGGDMGYHKAAALPTELSSVITSLNVGDVSQPIVTPEGIDIVKLANKRSSDNLIIPQWHTRHILIKVDEQQSDELAEQKINDLYEQLRRGADFAQLASTYSDDLGSAGRGGDLDWVEEGMMVAPFEATMKATTKGNYSAPFKTQFGWHILQVLDQRQQDVSEEYRRKLARDALYQRLAPQAKEDWLQELRASAYVKVLED